MFQQLKVWSFALLTCMLSFGSPLDEFKVKGFTLTEIGGNKYDAIINGSTKTAAQMIIDRLYTNGVRHIVLTPRALMFNPRGSQVIPMTPEFERADEKARYLRLMQYIHGMGMTVGLRPILFVVDENLNTPLIEVLPDGTEKVWWHGNIQPVDANAWFDNFEAYMKMYAQIGNEGLAEEFTIGAELHSMTVGNDEGGTFSFKGYPSHWYNMAVRMKNFLRPGTRMMYDVNYTDEAVPASPTNFEGGELAKFYTVALLYKGSNDPRWMAFGNFLKTLDMVGIDMYRSLANNEQEIPTDYQALVDMLKVAVENYATEIEGYLDFMSGAVQKDLRFTIKEVGYRSVDKSFIDPFTYAGTGTFNADHQAAAYEALLSVFEKHERYDGVVFWDASVDLDRHGPFDLGFSPLGKEVTESVLKKYFQ